MAREHIRTIGQALESMQHDATAPRLVACPASSCRAPVGERCRRKVNSGPIPFTEFEASHRARRTAAARAGHLHPSPKES